MYTGRKEGEGEGNDLQEQSVDGLAARDSAGTGAKEGFLGVYCVPNVYLWKESGVVADKTARMAESKVSILLLISIISRVKTGASLALARAKLAQL